MARKSDDPYGDFVVRVMNSCRIALNQMGTMNDHETSIVLAVQEALVNRDPDAIHTAERSIISGPYRANVERSGA